MRTYIVNEVIEYRVEAESAEAAVQHVIDDGDRNSHCLIAILERDAYLAQSPAWVRDED